MIVWRGRGIFVVVIGIGVLVLTQLFFDGVGGKGYYETHAFPKVLAGLLAALPIWFLGKKWNDESGRVHDLFFVPMQYWAFVVFALMLWVGAMPSDPKSQTQAQAEQQSSEPAPASSPAPAQAAPVVAASVITPPPQAARRQTDNPERQRAERPAVERPTLKYVYADNASHQYYPENCAGRPEKAYRIGRSIARGQGYTLAPGCSE